ncbi:hypothetical protein [Tatumella ptyseos]|uniref:hypothetical protein n=1 Tax=Tatumella ptyseos TaxID=82987 RepID=UPI0011AB3765|nr:hypothetical protein [Tatumella ptyseos]
MFIHKLSIQLADKEVNGSEVSGLSRGECQPGQWRHSHPVGFCSQAGRKAGQWRYSGKSGYRGI